MRHRLALSAALAVAAQAAAASGAGPPTIQTARPCYLAGQAVRITGQGFHAGDRYTVTLDHAKVGTGTVRAAGAIGGQLASGALPAGADRVLHRIIVTDGALTARIGFHTSAFRATISPASGDPRTLRVRYTVDAIGLSAPAGATVWLHYVDPAGQVRRSVAIGRTSGVCGSLHSIRHRLFPLAVRAGVWGLQFDLSPAYSAATRPRIVRQIALG
jgi:hypothetical protein